MNATLSLVIVVGFTAEESRTPQLCSVFVLSCGFQKNRGFTGDGKQKQKTVRGCAHLVLDFGLYTTMVAEHCCGLLELQIWSR